MKKITPFKRIYPLLKKFRRIKVKIFFITMQFPNPREAFASKEIGHLKQQGVDASVFSYRTRHPLTDELIEERALKDIPLSFTNSASVFNSIFIGLSHPKVLFTLLYFIFKFHYNEFHHLVKTLILAPRTLELFKEIKQQQPDVVHLYWSHYPSLLGILIKKFLPNIKVTMSLAAYDIRLNYKGSRFLAPLADKVTTHCKKNIPIILEYGISPSHISVAYRGIANKYFQGDIHQKTPFSIITAGALVKEKGMDEVILIYEQIKANFPMAILTILGNGPELENLKQLVKKRRIQGVEFGGHVSHTRLMSAMATHEIFLFMSHKERIPNVAKEAIANYCYPVVSNTVGIDELIQDGVTGSIIPIHDKEAACIAIQKAFKEPARVKAEKDLAYQHVKKHFNLEIELQTYFSLWQSLTNATN